MAETVYDVIDDTVKKPQFSSDVTNLCCESCVIVKDQLLQVFQELKICETNYNTSSGRYHQVKRCSF